ncbi:MAG: hypothetical protein EBR82_75485, partial [Caulobacteraceae bacterium]|nr:hypothetical protein [Caulobacteraceae bacterium]
MRFDRFEADAVAEAKEVLPDGDHVCEITGDKTWVSQDGSREAVIVTFTPVNGAPAFDKFLDPSEERDHKAAHQLLGVLGLGADAELGDGAAKGLRVTVTTKRAVDKAGDPVVDKRSGLQRIWVNGFKPAPAAPAAVPKWKQTAEDNAQR